MHWDFIQHCGLALLQDHAQRPDLVQLEMSIALSSDLHRSCQQGCVIF